MEILLIKDALVVPMTAKEGACKSFQASVGVVGNRIVLVSDEVDVVSSFLVKHPDCRIMDGSGKALLPGLINTHCHAAMTLQRNHADDIPLMAWLNDHIWPFEARQTKEDIALFAKIENMDGVEHLDELLPHCEEIVIARGDLGNAMPLWELPAVQKRISAKCREAGKNFMVVTQMLWSMEKAPVPTRAEVSDIFNAVYDGCASVMVTGETAVGKYPVEVIKYLSNTAKEAEKYR